MDLHKFGSDVHVWNKIICSNFWDPFFHLLILFSSIRLLCRTLSVRRRSALRSWRKRWEKAFRSQPRGRWCSPRRSRHAHRPRSKYGLSQLLTHAWNCMYKDPNLSLNSTPISYFLKQTQMSSLLRIFLIHSFALRHIWTYDEKTYGQTYLKLHKNSFWHR